DLVERELDAFLVRIAVDLIPWSGGAERDGTGSRVRAGREGERREKRETFSRDSHRPPEAGLEGPALRRRARAGRHTRERCNSACTMALNLPLASSLIARTDDARAGNGGDGRGRRVGGARARSARSLGTRSDSPCRPRRYGVASGRGWLGGRR